MESNHVYVLDANVLISAHRWYYHFDFCTRFWDRLIEFARQNKLHLTGKIYDEILRGHDPKKPEEPDQLAIWTSTQFKTFVLSDEGADVQSEFQRLCEWVDAQSYSDPVKEAFFSGVDGWLVAFAMATGYTLVTLEKDPNNKKSIPIPRLCKEFRVRYLDTFQMLHELKIKLS